MPNLKFMEASLEGEALLEEIDDYVEEWHSSDTEEELHEYLGMSFEEYALWVENDSLLKTIFNSRITGEPLQELIHDNYSQKLVARASSPEEAKETKVWLRKTGRLS